MPSPTPSQTEVFERTNEYTVLAWRRVMLLVWRGQATAAGIDRSRAIFEPWVERQTSGGAFLIVVPGHRTPPPDERTRAAMQRASSTPVGPFKGMATLIEAEGFVAATVRSIMTRLQGGGGAKVFRTTAETASWAAELLGDPELTAAGLDEAIRQGREG